MKIAALSSGQLVYSVDKTTMGNTSLKTISVYPVTVTEVRETSVMASWNGNAPRRFSEAAVKKWKVEKPVLVSNGFGTKRLATKDEIAQMKADF
ncbi:hypothetical protein [Buttiauxella gaviniae]|uniref:hypothetical protein n=1 Tax=Buttiauxella gaviniae TaxID=82990 RepID=UPI003C785DE4